MDKKIIFNGQEFEDKLVITSSYRVPLHHRFRDLFHPERKIETLVYTKQVMPAHAVECIVHGYSYWDIFKRRFQKKGGMITIYTKEECPLCKQAMEIQKGTHSVYECTGDGGCGGTLYFTKDGAPEKVADFQEGIRKMGDAVAKNF